MGCLHFCPLTFIECLFCARHQAVPGCGQIKSLYLNNLAGRPDSVDCLGRLGKEPGEHRQHPPGWLAGRRLTARAAWHPSLECSEFWGDEQSGHAPRTCSPWSGPGHRLGSGSASALSALSPMGGCNQHPRPTPAHSRLSLWVPGLVAPQRDP